MWNEFLAALRTQLGNQVVAGGLALALMGVVLASLRRLPGWLWGQAQRALVVQATLDSRDDTFAAFVAWLNDQRVGRRSRWFSVVQAPAALADDDPAGEGLPSLLYSPAPGFHLFWHGGRLMWLQREITMNLHVVETLRVGMLGGSRARMEALFEGVLRHAVERRAHRLVLYTVDRYGDDWRLADTKPRRSLESVVLDSGLAERLRDDIHHFFQRRDWYAQMGIPWRRGYLLYGPPGTGKTSIAHALAGELRLKLCALSLTHPKLNDSVLADLLQRTPPRSLILIEDVDAFFVARDKQDMRIEVSFSGLLNALDGVAAQEGRIVVLTTNHRERLDAALIRPGRIDMELALQRASAAQLQRLVLRFYPQSTALAARLAADYPAQALSPAQIQQALLASSDADTAEVALRAALLAALPQTSGPGPAAPLT